jgi:hypothetical protein
VPNEEKVVFEIELDPAQLEQVLGEIAELRAEVARLSATVQILQSRAHDNALDVKRVTQYEYELDIQRARQLRHAYPGAAQLRDELQVVRDRMP